MKYSPLLILALLAVAGCQCGGPATISDPDPAPGSSAAAGRTDAIIAAADATPDSSALDAAIDEMFAADDREMAQFAEAEAEATRPVETE